MTRNVHVATSEAVATERCPYCFGGIDAAVVLWTCPGCGTRLHGDCARENGCCTVLGCRRSFAGRGVAPKRPVRMLPRGAPRSDFRVGVALTVLGAVITAVALLASPGPLVFYAAILPVGLLTIVHALYRAITENRWRD